MNIAVTIGGTDRTAVISWPSFTIDDALNSEINTCEFDIVTDAVQTYAPSKGLDIIVTDGGTRIFAGTIVTVETTVEGDRATHHVTCKDYAYALEGVLVSESYANKTVKQIIDDIATNYLNGMDTTNVVCAIATTKVVFDRLTASECIDRLARAVNYSWYVDYDNKLYFFPANTHAAPFDVDGTSQNVEGNSVVITDNMAQMRNVVVVRGGDAVGTTPRTARAMGDGTAKVFGTQYKFDSLPTVTVDGAGKTVGIENIDSTGYDCYWDYNQKYIRFDSAPADGKPVEITGYPLVPIVVQVEDSASILAYGRREFAVTDKKIKSTADAQQYAMAQLESYAAGVAEGRFTAKTSGLASGQTININIAGAPASGQFIIQRVTLRMVSRTVGAWDVVVATSRTLGIIAFLRSLLARDANVDVASNEVLEKYYFDSQRIKVAEVIGLLVGKQDYQTAQATEDIVKDPLGAGVVPDFVLCPYAVTGHTDTKREFLLDRSPLG